VPSEQIIVAGGTAGLIAVLLYTANVLWNSHKDDDKLIRDEKMKLELANDKLQESQKDSLALLRDVRDDIRDLRERAAYHEPERARRRTSSG
jgi:type II secretory pathway component PulM